MKYSIQLALLGMASLLLSCGMDADAQKQQAKEDYFDEIDLAEPSWKLKIPGGGFVGEDSLGNPGVWVFSNPSETSDGIAALNFYSATAQFRVPVQDIIQNYYRVLSIPRSVWVKGVDRFIRYYPKPEIWFKPIMNTNDGLSWCFYDALNPELVPCEFPWKNQRPLSQDLYLTDDDRNFEWKWADSTIRIPKSTSRWGSESCSVIGLSNSGEFLWDTNLDFRASEMMSLPDGAYLVGVYAQEYISSEGQAHYDSGYAVIAKMDSKGELLWKAKVDENLEHNLEILTQIIAITPDSLLAIGYSGDERGRMYGTLLVLFNSSGTVLKTERFKPLALEFVSYKHGELVMYSHNNNWTTQSEDKSDGYLVGYQFP